MSNQEKESNNHNVVILMCTFNGERYLAEQLDSIASQTYKSWRLVVSDDGSSDATLEILKQYKIKLGASKIELREGPREGFSKNFLSLACDPSIQAEFYAFCDQDDVWLPNKLEAAIEYLESHSLNTPRLYCGRTISVSNHLVNVGMSPAHSFPCSFRNALVQSIAGGNTMVFNDSVKRLLESAGIHRVACHDWWTYLLVSGSGGHVHYDDSAYVLYRQHDAALIGNDFSIQGRLSRINKVIKGRFKNWTNQHVEALEACRYLLDNHSRDIFDTFVRLRNSKLIYRFRMIQVCGLYRQTKRGTFTLYLAALFNKI